MEGNIDKLDPRAAVLKRSIGREEKNGNLLAQVDIESSTLGTGKCSVTSYGSSIWFWFRLTFISLLASLSRLILLCFVVWLTFRCSLVILPGLVSC